MLTPQIDIDSSTFASVVGGRWIREYASSRANGGGLFVFRRLGATRDLLVLRDDDIGPCARRLKVPGVGQMFCHRFTSDPALQGLGHVLDTYVSYDVLRYRPGKRITIAAFDPVQGPVIVKCVAAGIGDIYQQQSVLWESQAELGFRVSQPLLCLDDWNTFVQRRLPGKPIPLADLVADTTIASKMAIAIHSLHRSDVCFDAIFGPSEQQARSMRYAKIIKMRLPSLGGDVDALMQRLARIEFLLNKHSRCMVPIHGSLHRHQWLRDGKHLALVDFDRAAMGHAELDIATFLAEIDYESLEDDNAIARAFLNQFEGFDPLALCYYRAHKHLAKAFKASKTTDQNIGAAKTKRNLRRANNLLHSIQDRRQ